MKLTDGLLDDILKQIAAGRKWKEDEYATFEIVIEELKQARAGQERALANLHKAVSYLHACKRQFAPDTTNSEVDMFLERMGTFE